MFKNDATLHLLVGKIGSGKSTLAEKLTSAPHTVIISEDVWLASLYGEEMRSVQDYLDYSARLRGIMETHLVELLRSGLSVVLDFPANTLEMRGWMHKFFEKAECVHKLHYLDVSEDICLDRLHKRNAEGTHPFAATDAQFHLINSHFVEPTADEGFDITVYG